MTLDFTTDELAKAIEAGFGVAVRATRRLPGHAHSFNFRIEADGGLVFVAKCLPTQHLEARRRLCAHLDSLRNSGTVKMMFGGRTATIGGWTVLCISWVDGESRPPQEITDSELDSFIAAHERNCRTACDDGYILPVRDGLAAKRALLAKLDKKRDADIVRELRLMSDESLVLKPSSVRIIHGDCHWENMRFKDGRLNGFLDVEELRFGTPAEDYVRYIACSEEHLRWWNSWRSGQIVSAFRRILARTSLTRNEWLFAINGYLLRKISKKTKAGRMSLPQRLGMRWRFRFYHILRDIVIESTPPAPREGRTIVKIMGGTVRRFVGAKTFDWNDRLRFTTDPGCEDYDWLCVYDELTEKYPCVNLGRMRLRCPRARTIILTQEPTSVKSYNSVYTRQFATMLTNRPPEADSHPGYRKGSGYMVWYTGRSFAEERAHAIPEKTKLISAVYSSKRMKHTQHANRYRLMEVLRDGLDGFDWFGKGVKPLARKSDALDAYKYYVAVENHIGPGHWTEKLADALVAGCLPFYAGDPAIGEILPPRSFIPIPIDDPEAALAIIRRAIADGEYEKRRDAIAEARELLLTRYNLFAQIAAAIEASPEAAAAAMPKTPQYIVTRHHARLNFQTALEDLAEHIRRVVSRPDKPPRDDKSASGR